jgi:hypothetical protein
MDEKGAAMNRMPASSPPVHLGRFVAIFRLLLVLLLLAPVLAEAHVGSPDVFFDGPVGPYPAQITIRMPPVVPGRAQIEVRPQTKEVPLTVSFLPLYAKTATKNAPPADVARLAADEPGVYTGELWLMSMGGYSIEVRVAGPAGAGSVQIPVNSVATHQLPMPPFLGNLLLALGGILALGLLAIVCAAAGESVLEPGASMHRVDRRRGLVAAAVTAMVVVFALVGGWRWWQLDEQSFQRKLRDGAWPDLVATVDSPLHASGPGVLHLTIGEKAFEPDKALRLLRDHDKLVHMFLIREPARDAFAHVHPVRTGGKTFDLALPPLPEGDYRMLCDLTFGDLAVSSTAAGTVHLPPPAESPVATSNGKNTVRPDADDSWTAASPIRDAASISEDTIFMLPGGRQLRWKAHPPLRARHDAHLQFEARDAAGQPLPLEPYMGMLSHAAVLRSDGAIFCHLHPTGNYSMAAQSFFATKMATESAPTGESDAMPAAMDHAHMHHGTTGSTITLPYEFPSQGEYQIWVQIKTAGEVLTGTFVTNVSP